VEKQLQDIYNKLASTVVSMIPTGWSEIYYLGEVEKNKDSWSSVFYFKDTKSIEYVKCHNIPETYSVSNQIFQRSMTELNEQLLNIYNCFIENEQEAWDQMCLKIDKNGKFSINYKYNQLDEEDDQVARETIWAYETFQLFPEEGSYTRSILDKYLANK